MGLAAILLIVAALLGGPAWHRIAQVAPSGDARIRESARAFALADGATLIVATADGATLLTGGQARDVPLSRLSSWMPPGLPDPVALIVTPGGMEADFLLGSALTRAGVGTVTRTRIAGRCPSIGRTAGGIGCISP